METKSKSSKKFMYTKVLPILFFVLITAAVICIYYNRLRSDISQLAQKQATYALQKYALNIETHLNQIDKQLVLAEKMVENEQISVEDAMALLADKADVSVVALVDSMGIGADADGNELDLQSMGLSYAIDNARSTYFCADNGVVYIGKSISGMDNQAIVVGFDTSEFDKQMADYEFSSENWFIVQNESGKIIYSLNGDQFDYVKKGANFLTSLKSAEGRSSVVSSGISKHRNDSAMVEFGNDRRQVFYHYIETGNLTVVMGITDAYFADAMKPYEKTIRNMLLSLMGCICIYMVIVVVNSSLDKATGKKKSEGLMHLAETDQLTGLYNKMTTERKIQEYIDENPDSQSALFVLDIDNFKKINDTMGHAFGDEVLREIGIGLKGQFRASDIIGRAGGDEFIILLKNLKEDEYIFREAHKLENFFRGLQVGTYTKYSVTSSIGCAIFSRDGDSFESLYKRADEALYKAKQRGKNQLAFYKDVEGFGQNV